MPFLDVSSVLLDPQFADTYSVTRREQTVGNDGLVATSNTTVNNIVGVFTMASPNDLERLDDHQRMGRVMSLITQYRLRGPSLTGSKQWQPDIITFLGDTFVVSTVEPYTRYGAGFVQAIITSIDAIDPAPGAEEE